MPSPHSSQPYAAAAAPPPQPPRRPRWRTARRALGGLLALALVLLGALWWWAGTSTSLASALTRAAQYLPAGQSLQARGVSGSLRGGGTIGWLRWSSPTLAVEVHGAHIGWRLAPLLQRTVQLGEVHATLVTLTPQPDPHPTPTEPPTALHLPVQVSLPFRADRVVWAAASPITIDQLAGSYRYDGAQHHLAVDSLALAQGRYALQATVQGAAPMAVQATLSGTVHTAIPGGALGLTAQAQASAHGTLATQDARLALSATLHGAPEPGTEQAPLQTPIQAPMQASVQARIAPWAPQPLLQAQAALQALNLAALWPQAPATQLSGTAALEPTGSDAAGWRVQADLRNALPGPWDRQRLPLTAVQARATFDGAQWSVPEATLEAGNGHVALQGSYTPATHALQGQAQVRALSPALLHTQLDAAPLNGSASATGQADGAVRFALQLRSAAATTAATTTPSRRRGAGPLRIDTVAANGVWQGERIDIAHLQLDALQAQVRGQALRIDTAGPAAQGRLQATLPGAAVQVDGQLAPRSGSGSAALRLTDAPRLQQWLARLPGLSAAAAGWSLDGSAELNARWSGGWQDLQRQLHAAGMTDAGASVGTRAGASHGPGGGFTLQAQLSAPRLQLARAPQPGSASGPLMLELLRTTAQLSGSVAQATLQWSGELRHGSDAGRATATGTGSGASSAPTRAQVQLHASAGSRGAGRWQASVETLRVQATPAGQSGAWVAQLSEPLAIDLQQRPRLRLQAGAGQLRLNGPQPGEVLLRWQPLLYAQGAQGAQQLRSQGELRGLPLAWANAFAMDGQPLLTRLGLGGDLRLDGAWNVDTGDAGSPLRARASLQRAGGDLRILAGEAPSTVIVHSSGQGTGAGAARATDAAVGSPAGVRTAQLQIDAQGEQLQARLQWDSERAGRLQAEASTRLTQQAGGWHWSADAPLAAQVRADLPDVGVWSALAPPGWRVQGTLAADAQLSGSRAAPQWRGQISAERFSVRSLVDGIHLDNGSLRATLQGDRLEITTLRIHGGPGSRARIAGYSGNRTAAPTDGGLLTGTGTVSWAGLGSAAAAGGSGIAMDIRAQAQRLQLLVRADRQVSVSGDLQARLHGGQFTLRGQLTTDRATIVLPEAGAPTLGSDVVVRSAALDRAAAAQAAQAGQAAGRIEAARAPDIAITLDLGDDFALQGHGITTRLAGRLDIRGASTPGAPPRVTGEVRTVQGRYRAWGQALDVESGLLRWNGPHDNPALDVLALRPNIAVRAGVQVSGTAQSPRVRLYAEPDLPDAEKLSWVVLGRSAAGGGAEAALLQQAALALLGGSAGSGTGGIARSLGLDEIGFKGPGAGEDASGAALTFGKRLSQDLYVTYERSISGVLGTLYIFYDLSRHLTLRGQTGLDNAVDLIYTVRYD